MNKRALSSILTGSKNEIILQQNLSDIEKEHDKKQIEYLKKQNGLLKKQLDQMKEIHSETKKQLNLYRGIMSTNYTNKNEFDTKMAQVFQMQQKKIFDLQTELQILRQKYNKSMLNTGSIKQTQYAIKCKQLERRLQNCERQYQKQISYLKQKIMRLNASEIIMDKNSSSNFISTYKSTDLTKELKPISGKLKKNT